jgi:hypothetical protein
VQDFSAYDDEASRAQPWQQQEHKEEEEQQQEEQEDGWAEEVVVATVQPSFTTVNG